MTQKKKQPIELNYWKIRLCLTIFVFVIFLLTFFLGGGLDYFKAAVAVKNFNKLPFEIHYIDVGLGDSIFMRFPNDKTMLIDCGPNEKENTLVGYLTDLFDYENIKVIDYLVLTHQDADHVGMGEAVFKAFQVNTLYRPKVLASSEEEKYGNPNNYKISSTKTYNNVITAAYNEPLCQINYSQSGITIEDSDFSVNFLSPSEENYSNSNDYSPMIMVTYATRKFLLTGDGEKVAENEVIALYGEKLKADVLKVGHHGSNTSTSDKFLSFVRPACAVISVSASNKYKFPKVETLGRLEAVNAKVYQTSKLGSIAMSVNEKGNLIIATSSDIFIIDVPLLFVFTAISLILIWGIKVKSSKKVKNQQKSS